MRASINNSSVTFKFSKEETAPQTNINIAQVIVWA